jgi:hypothetical protein
VKWFKLYDPVSKKMVLSRNVVFGDQSILKNFLEIDVSESAGAVPAEK